MSWIHFIGVAGVVTGQLAVECKRQGNLVSGSDRGFFPPVSDHLKVNDVAFEINYKEEHLDLSYYQEKYGGFWNKREKAYPDLVIIQGTKGEQNKEYLKAKELNIPIKYFPEVLQEKVIIPQNSIVVAGSYGKTTTTAMLSWIFETTKKPFSYMFGGLCGNFKNGVRFKSEDSQYSIVEGDEYVVSPENPQSKFFLYSPKYLVLTGIDWDHVDVFPTKQKYTENFKALIQKIPVDGIIIFDKNDAISSEIVKYSKCQKIAFEVGENLKQNIDLEILGRHNLKNAAAAMTMATYLGIPIKDIKNALGTFKGIRRRLEIRYEKDGKIVIDDFGASASKAKSAVNTIRGEFPDYKIIAIFEPNLGSRTYAGIDEYKGVFDGVDKLFLPRFTKVKGDYFSNKDLADSLQSMIATSVTEKDEELIKALLRAKTNKVVYLFLGSHGFRGNIETLIQKLKLRDAEEEKK